MKAAVIGTGLIGRSWAIVFARGGAEVALWDQDASQVEGALAFIGATLPKLEAAGLITDAQGPGSRLHAAPSLAAALDGARHVQENIAERAAPKQQLFAAMEPLLADHAVLASSTSAIMPSTLFAPLACRARCLVAHPMNPPHLAPFVELCGAPFTAPHAMAQARDFLAGCGMAPIAVRREIEGFVLNRLQHALLCEAFRLIANGYVSATDLDKALTDGLARRWSFMGPVETIDLNAPGGVADYMARYSETVRRAGMAATSGPDWPADIGARLAEERRAALPLDRLTEAQAWRDQRMMALAVHLAESAAKIPR
jgi:3-hydroxyacyl-CoA dehydrogenase